MEVVAPAVQLHANASLGGKPPRPVRREIVAPVAQWLQKGAIRDRPFIGDESVAVLQTGAEGQESALHAERAALNAGGPFVGQRFAQADVDHSEPAEVPVLGAERPVDETHLLDQFRA
jgi:hypothetical protein